MPVSIPDFGEFAGVYIQRVFNKFHIGVSRVNLPSKWPPSVQHPAWFQQK